MLGQRKHFSLTIIGLAALTCGLLAGTTIVLYNHFFTSSAPPALQHSVQQVSFPLYYPSALPVGYSFDASSLSSTRSVVLFSVQNKTTGDIISISEQPAPSSTLDLNTFYHNQFDSFNTIVTPIGNGVYGKDVQNATISIPSDHTWLIIRAPLTSGSQIKAMALKLVKLH